jgi:hypothetical protein
MAAEFEVSGTKFTITDMNMPAVAGSREWLAIFNGVKVDLSKPDADNLILFQKVPQVANNVFAYGAIQCKTKALIALVQFGLGQEVEAMTGQPIQRDVDGVYNCSDAQLMLMVAQTVRQTGAGDFDAWPLGPSELSYLLTRSGVLQGLIAEAIKKENVQTPEQTASYQYSMVSFPADMAPGMTFIPAQVPSTCQGKAPDMPAITPGSMCGTGLQYDATSGTCVKATPVAYKSEKKSWWMTPVAVGLGLIGAGSIVYYFYKPKTRKTRSR